MKHIGPPPHKRGDWAEKARKQPPPPGRRETTRSQEGAMVAVRIVESILDGDIGTLICALFPFAIATWWIIRVHILSARKWKPPLVSWEGESDGGPPLSPATPCPSARAHGKAMRQPTPRTAQSGPLARWPLSGPRQRLGGWKCIVQSLKEHLAAAMRLSCTTASETAVSPALRPARTASRRCRVDIPPIST